MTVTGVPSMTARDLERWVEGARSTMWERRIDVVFGRGADLGRDDAAAWISVTSATGSGRLLRHRDGRSEREARRHADGIVVLDATAEATLVADLWELVDAVTPSTGRDRPA